VPIQKLVLTHPVQGQLGTIYLDLGSRPGKYSHAAHYTIRCGCAVRPADDVGSTATASTASAQQQHAQYQTPVVVLVASLGLPRVAGGARLLSHGELDTLVHEFGHALHSALSRTEFQHTSGTRSAVRLVFLLASAKSLCFAVFVQALHASCAYSITVRKAARLLRCPPYSAGYTLVT
jgi:mitochondrial intermediate peptidase